MTEGSGFAPLHWQDEYSSVEHGEGVTRPKSGIRTKEYRLLVFVAGGRPMTWITRAESKRHAIKYAQARWPGSEVEPV